MDTRWRRRHATASTPTGLEALDVAPWWAAMGRWALASVLAAGGAVPALALDTCFGLDVAEQKNEANIVKTEITGVKVEVTTGERGRDDSAGQAGGTEYDGTAQRCPMGSDGRRHCQ